MRTILIAVCFLAAGALFAFAALKILFKRPLMAASPEVWIKSAQDPKTGKQLNFDQFPLKEEWTIVCIFPGHSTDAQMQSILPYKAMWKLSDKSQSTTRKDVFAAVFANEGSKTLVHAFDIPQNQLSFDKSLYQKCLPRKSSTLKRLKEATQDVGPLFGN